MDFPKCWSIRLSSNQQILLHACIENIHSVRQCPMKIVNLTCRSALIGFFHCSSTCRREQVRNSVEVYGHKNSNKIEWEGIQTTQQKSHGKLSSLRNNHLLMWLFWLEFLITWYDICQYINALSDGWMSWQKYPWIGKWFRIYKNETLDSNICPTYPGMGCGTLACIRGLPLQVRFFEKVF